VRRVGSLARTARGEAQHKASLAALTHGVLGALRAASLGKRARDEKGDAATPVAQHHFPPLVLLVKHQYVILRQPRE
jgi:hypothetical protein